MSAQRLFVWDIRQLPSIVVCYAPKQKLSLGSDLTLRDFDESQHPRDESGKFTSNGSGANANHADIVTEKAKVAAWESAGGSDQETLLLTEKEYDSFNKDFPPAKGQMRITHGTTLQAIKSIAQEGIRVDKGQGVINGVKDKLSGYGDVVAVIDLPKQDVRVINNAGEVEVNRTIRPNEIKAWFIRDSAPTNDQWAKAYDEAKQQREFDESQHPRDESGKFAPSGGGTSESSSKGHRAKIWTGMNGGGKEYDGVRAAMSKVLDKVPDADQRDLSIGIIGELGASDSEGDTQGEYRSMETRINGKVGVIGTVDVYAKRYEGADAASVYQSLEDTVTHEIGHHAFRLSLYGDDKAMAAREEFIAGVRADKRRISDYAEYFKRRDPVIDANESFAECYRIQHRFGTDELRRTGIARRAEHTVEAFLKIQARKESK